MSVAFQTFWIGTSYQSTHSRRKWRVPTLYKRLVLAKNSENKKLKVVFFHFLTSWLRHKWKKHLQNFRNVFLYRISCTTKCISYLPWPFCLSKMIKNWNIKIYFKRSSNHSIFFGLKFFCCRNTNSYTLCANTRLIGMCN